VTSTSKPYAAAPDPDTRPVSPFKSAQAYRQRAAELAGDHVGVLANLALAAAALDLATLNLSHDATPAELANWTDPRNETPESAD
jgi:hypothetical protein